MTCVQWEKIRVLVRFVAMRGMYPLRQDSGNLGFRPQRDHRIAALDSGDHCGRGSDLERKLAAFKSAASHHAGLVVFKHQHHQQIGERCAAFAKGPQNVLFAGRFTQPAQRLIQQLCL